VLSQLIDRAETDGLDTKVTSDFDWGRDEFDSHWRTRLQRTRRQSEIQGESSDDSSPDNRHPSQTDYDKSGGENATDDKPSAGKAPATGLARVPEYESALTNRVKHMRLDDSVRKTEEDDHARCRGRDEFQSSTKSGTISPNASNASIDDFEYRVRPGDTLSQIVVLYGIPAKQVVADNDIRNPSYIKAGQILKLRVALSNAKR
jgi:LysM repeat protein